VGRTRPACQFGGDEEPCPDRWATMTCDTRISRPSLFSTALSLRFQISDRRAVLRAPVICPLYAAVNKPNSFRNGLTFTTGLPVRLPANDSNARPRTDLSATSRRSICAFQVAW
jgi:hypothetical protein